MMNLKHIEKEDSRQINGGYVAAGVYLASKYAKNAWNLGQYIGYRIMSRNGRKVKVYYWK